MCSLPLRGTSLRTAALRLQAPRRTHSRVVAMASQVRGPLLVEFISRRGCSLAALPRVVKA
jgi:hypothetical protein